MNTCSTLMKIATLAATLSAALAAGTAHAELQARLGGQAVYDTGMNITWLANANLGGQMNWDAAQGWIAGLNAANHLGFHDWRLPATLQPDASCDTQSATRSAGYHCTGSEMGHLFYVELGGLPAQSINATHNASFGLFQNFQDYSYWSGTEYAQDANLAWNFLFNGGTQHASYLSGFKGDGMYALAVRPGDVTAVPEAATWVMLLAGLGLIVVTTSRRRGRGSSSRSRWNGGSAAACSAACVAEFAAEFAALGAAVCALASAPALAASTADNFESYATGSFPSPKWSEFATFYPSDPNYPPAALPSMTVVDTLDAFGQPTKALQNVDGAGAPKGIYAPQATGNTLSASADVRTLRYSNSNPAFVQPWQDAAASLSMFTANPASSPFASIYASSTTQGWRFAYTGDAAIAPLIDDFDLGASALLGVWYHVALDVDRQTGSFHSRITDIASGVVVVDSVINYANWNTSYDNFDSILFSPYEVNAALPWGPHSTTIANIMQVDNINIAAVPEPGTSALMLAGLLALARLRRRHMAYAADRQSAALCRP